MANVLRDRLLATPAVSRALDRDEMLAFAHAVDIATLDLESHKQFCETRYARNTVFKNEYFELVVICWLSKQASSIHDHGRSNCLYIVVDGIMREEMFELDGAGKPCRTSAREFTRGGITIAAPQDVHRIVNVGESGLVTVHVYSPPLDATVTNFTPIPEYKTKLPAV